MADALGEQGRRIRKDGNLEAWAKQLVLNPTKLGITSNAACEMPVGTFFVIGKPFSNYQIVETLGGGMGGVYKARNTRFDGFDDLT